ncbi:MAG: hybrid sensor histidine kinase/response regulator, partial [Planctomycetota bacterium]
IAVGQGDDIAANIDEIFRQTHTIKGAALAVQQTEIAEVCHHLESLFSDLRSGATSPTSLDFDLLLAACDFLSQAVDDLNAGRAIDSDNGQSWISTLAGLSGNTGPDGGSVIDLVSAPVVEPSVAPDTPSFAPEPEATPAPSTPNPDADPPSTSSLVQHHRILRVDGSDIDQCLAHSGELVVASRWLGERAEDGLRLRQRLDSLINTPTLDGEALLDWRRAFHAFVYGISEQHKELVAHAESLHHDLRELCLVPFEHIAHSFGRLVRDVARKCDKLVEYQQQGTATTLERGVLDGLREPLQHIFRNAVFHGIEPATERRAAGKAERGTIRLTVSRQPGHLAVTIADDGRGIDPAAIRARCQRLGLTIPDAADAIYDALFIPGFSTADTVTDIAGRGVGMDAVKQQLEELRGTIAIESTPGRGTTFRLTIPNSLSTIQGLVIRAGGQQFSVPVASIDSLHRIDPSTIAPVAGRDTITIDGNPITVVDLARLLGIGPSAPPNNNRLPTLVLSARHRRLAVIVDAFEQEVRGLIMGLGRRLGRLPLIAGATRLSRGELVPILHPADIIDHALGTHNQGLHYLPVTEQQPQTILVVDDSPTIRGMLRTVLEASGYQVLLASDGQQALSSLAEHAVDLVVSDVEMPNLNGLDLTRAIRASETHRNLPVILVTSLADEADRQAGADAGADVYVVKQAFDQQQLLAEIAGQLT